MRRWLPLVIVPPALLGASAFLWALVSVTLRVHFPSDLGWLAPKPVQAAEPIAKTPEVVKETPKLATPAVFAEPTPCGGGGRVVLTVADEQTPADSMAVVSMPAGKGVVRPGSFLGGRPVLAVSPLKVYLGGKSICYLDGIEHAGTPESTAKKPLVVAGKGVEMVDDRHIKIDRALRDQLLETGGADLQKTFRVAPDVEGGKMVGMRVLGVQEGSLLSKLGLRAGDKLRGVNGLPLAGPEQLLELYARLRTAPHLELELLRDGTKKIVEIDVI